MGGKRQQRIASMEAQWKLDLEKYGHRRFRWRKPCAEEHAYMRGFAKAKYGVFVRYGRHS